MLKQQVRGLLWGLAATFLWASFYPICRVLLGDCENHLDPFFFSFLRFVFGALILAPVLFPKKSQRKLKQTTRKDWAMLFFLATTGIIGQGVLVFWATKYTTASRASLMANTSPIFTIILSFLVLKEALTKKKIAGMILGFAGISLVILTRGGGDVLSTNSSTLFGDVLALISGMFWAVYTVYGETLSRRYGGLLCTAVLFEIGVLLMIPILFLTGSNCFLNLPWMVWLGIIYIGGAGGLAYGFWYCALKYLTPGELGILGYLNALLVVLLSVLFLKEKITWEFIAAIAMVFYSVYLMMKRDSPLKK